MISILDIIASVALLCILIILLYKWIKDIRRSKFILFITFLFLFVSTLLNLPEHLLETSMFDEIEVIFDILFIPTLILAIYISILDKELIKRTISETKLKAIIGQAYSLVGILDKEGKLENANEMALGMIGKSMEEVYMLPFQNTAWWTHSPEEQQKITDGLAKARRGEFCHFETTHLHKDNRVRIIDFSVKPVFINSTELAYIIVEGRDITYLKEIQKELEEHKNNLEKLVREKTEDLETAYEELKATNEELFSKNEIINEQNAELKDTLKYLKEAQNQLIKSEKMASLGILTAGVSHEINNPLNYLMGAYYGLEDYFLEYGSNDDTKTKILLEGIKTGIHRISNIVKGLNQLSSNNDNIYEACDLHAILNNSMSVLQSESKNKATFTRKYTSEDLIINGHSANLHQTLINILRNALHAIKDTGDITIVTRKNNAEAYIEIIDNGTGINPAHMNKITEPFFTTRDPGEGTGLGLSIASSIIQDHHGNITFESEENRGTKVTITFPSL